jgi:hypothetical protein
MKIMNKKPLKYELSVNKKEVKRLAELEVKAQVLSKEMVEIEGKIAEKEAHLKTIIGIKINIIEAVLKKYKKLSVKFQDEIDLDNSYGGPSSDNGVGNRMREEKIILLKDIVSTFEKIINSTLEEYNRAANEL